MYSHIVRTVFVLSFILSAHLRASASEDANSLYQQACNLEFSKNFTEALALYNRICTKFASDPFAGHDKAGFRIKYTACKMSLENGDFTQARTLAQQIKNLPSSAEQKPYQLYMTGYAFGRKKLFSEAAEFYKILEANYPDASQLKTADAAFSIKYVLCGAALQQGDIAGAREIAGRIKTLASPANDKACQLYMTGHLFNKRGLYADAQSLYQQTMTEYPDSPYSGPDCAGFHVSYASCGAALEKGDIEAAKGFANQIKSLVLSPEEKPYKLNKTGGLFIGRALLSVNEESGKVDEMLSTAELVYDEFLKTANSNNGYFKIVSANKDAVGVIRLLNLGDSNAAEAGIDRMKAKYANRDDIAMALCNIAEGYYRKGCSNSDKKFFRRSVELLENDITGASENILFSASRYYTLALNYRELGEYQKAAQAFEKAYQSNPGGSFAAYCLYKTGTCYERLMADQLVQEAEARRFITVQYNRLIAGYPQSEYVPYASKWLKKSQQN